MASEKTLIASIDKTYDLYFQMLSLIVEVARYADERQQAAMQKKLPTYEDLNPNRKFVENAVVHRGPATPNLSRRCICSWSRASITRNI